MQTNSFFFSGPSVITFTNSFGTYEAIRRAALWTDAFDYCKATGGHLITLETPNELPALTVPVGKNIDTIQAQSAPLQQPAILNKPALGSQLQPLPPSRAGFIS